MVARSKACEKVTKGGGEGGAQSSEFMLYDMDRSFQNVAVIVDTEIRISTADNPELCNVLSVNHGAGQNIALHASLATSSFAFH